VVPTLYGRQAIRLLPRGLAAAANQVCDGVAVFRFALRAMRLFGLFVDFNRLTRKHQIVWVLYGQASRAISTG
jgi:hypothetical protein